MKHVNPCAPRLAVNSTFSPIFAVCSGQIGKNTAEPGTPATNLEPCRRISAYACDGFLAWHAPAGTDDVKTGLILLVDARATDSELDSRSSSGKTISPRNR